MKVAIAMSRRLMVALASVALAASACGSGDPQNLEDAAAIATILDAYERSGATEEELAQHRQEIEQALAVLPDEDHEEYLDVLVDLAAPLGQSSSTTAPSDDQEQGEVGDSTNGEASAGAPTDEASAGEVTVLANEYPLPDSTGWSTTAVFELTNTGDDIIAVPYRVQVASADGRTTATSDGTDAVILVGGETTTIVLDGLDPTGDNPPIEGTVTVYGRTGQPAAALLGAPDWTSANEAFDCNNGLVGCGFNGDLTYHGPDMTSPGRIQIVAYENDEIVAAGHPTTEVPHVLSGETIPYAGQITSATDFDGAGVTQVDVAIEQVSEGD